MSASHIRLPIYSYEDDEASILALRSPPEGHFLPDLVGQVAQAIRRYPNSEAPSWLAPVAAIGCVERWLLAHGGQEPHPAESILRKLLTVMGEEAPGSRAWNANGPVDLTPTEAEYLRSLEQS